jgi:hypothetical protein
MTTENDVKTVREDDKKFQIWNSLLNASLKIPGAKVDRSAFLRSQLKSHFDDCPSHQIMRPEIC